MNRTPLLHNETLLLRAIEPEDIDVFSGWENDTGYWETGNTIAPFSRFALKQYIQQATQDIYETKEIRFIIERKSDGVSVGTIDVSRIDFFHKRAEMGILIDKACQEKGYAVMALNVLQEYVFGFIGLQQLYCHVSVTNIASQRMLERVGFEQVGTLINWLRRGDAFHDAFFYQLQRAEK